MAAILKLRRGTSFSSPQLSEPFFDTTKGTLLIGSGSGYITLSRMSSGSVGRLNTGDFWISGDVTASNLNLSGDISATNANLSGNITIGGNIFLGDQIANDNISIQATLSGSLIPSASNEYDLGTSAKYWRNSYLTSASILDITLPGSDIVSGSSQVDHDLTTNYVANEHIDHTTVSISAGSGLSGGGDISSSRTLSLDANSVTFINGVKSKLNSDGVISGSEQVQINSVSGFTAYSSSVDSRLDSLENFSSSEYLADSSSFDSRLDDVEWTGSNHESRIDVIETTFSSSVDSRLDYLEGGFSESVDLRLDNAEWTGSDHENRIDTLETTFSSSVDSRLDDLEWTGSNHESRLDVIETTFSSSVDLRLDNTEWTGSNHESRLDVIETTFSSSVDSRLDDAEWTGSNHESRLDYLEGDFSSSVSGNLTSIHQYTSSLKSAIDVDGSNLTVLGNLTVQGTQTSLNTTELLVEDILLALASGSTTSGQADGGGIYISGADASMTWNHPNQLMEFNTKVSSSVGFKGDGSELTGIQHGNIIFHGSNIVSSSQQISNYNTFLEINGDSVVSSSQQIIDLLPDGVISGSSQLTTEFDSRYLNTNGDSVVSSSQQISDYNTFLEINGDSVVSSSEQISNYGVFAELNGDSLVSSSTQISEYGVFAELNGDSLVSSSEQVISHLNGSGIVSSSEQISSYNTFLEINGDGVVSGSSFTSFHQGALTASINGTETNIDLGLEITDTPTFSGLTLTSLSSLGSGDVTALFSGSGGQVGTRALGTAAFLNVSASVGDDPNSVPTNQAVNNALIAAGAGDLTEFNPTNTFDPNKTGLVHLSSGTEIGGVRGVQGNIHVAIDTGSNHFGEGIIKSLPSGVISGSSQITITESQISDLSHYTDSDTLNYINGKGVVSGSAQTISHLNGSGIVSSSAQTISHLNGTGIISSSEQIDSNFFDIDGLVSSSTQISNYGVFAELNGDGLISSSAQILNGSNIVSSSAQISAYNTFLEINGDSVVSSSAQISAYNTFLEINGDGVVSGSSQINNLFVGTLVSTSLDSRLDVLEGETHENPLTFTDTSTIDFNRIGDTITATAIGGIVSSSAQTIEHLNGSGIVSSSEQLFEPAGFGLDARYLNHNGDSVVSSSAQIKDLGFVDLTSAQTISGTKTFSDIVVNGTGSFAYIQSTAGSAKIIGDSFIILNNETPTQRYAGISVQDSGSANTTASLQFDGQTNDWFYEYSTDGGVTTDHGVVLFGPEYSGIGNPTYPTNNRVQKGNGGHHLLDSNITDTGTLITLGSNTKVNGTFVASGTTLYSSSLQVTKTLQEVTTAGNTTSNSVSITNSTASTSKTTGALKVTGGVGISGDLNVGGDVVAYASSDERLKDEITPISNSLEKINKIGGYSFVWNDNQNIYNGKDYGVIAQEIEQVLPELVNTREDGYKAVKYDRIVSLLIEGIKDLSKEVENLKKQINKG